MSAAPDLVLPSAVKVVNAWAKSRPAITDLVGKRISPVLDRTLPAIRLTNVGPRDRGPEEALARVQVECWSDDHDTAEDIANAVVAQLPSLPGEWAGGWCAGGGVAMGPFSSPDPQTERARYLLDLEIWIYPAPPNP
jgi:hypothetical protein